MKLRDFVGAHHRVLAVLGWWAAVTWSSMGIASPNPWIRCPSALVVMLAPTCLLAYLGILERRLRKQACAMYDRLVDLARREARLGAGIEIAEGIAKMHSGTCDSYSFPPGEGLTPITWTKTMVTRTWVTKAELGELPPLHKKPPPVSN